MQIWAAYFVACCHAIQIGEESPREKNNIKWDFSSFQGAGRRKKSGNILGKKFLSTLDNTPRSPRWHVEKNCRGAFRSRGQDTSLEPSTRCWEMLTSFDYSPKWVRKVGFLTNERMFVPRLENEKRQFVRREKWGKQVGKYWVDKWGESVGIRNCRIYYKGWKAFDNIRVFSIHTEILLLTLDERWKYLLFSLSQ